MSRTRKQTRNIGIILMLILVVLVLKHEINPNRIRLHEINKRVENIEIISYAKNLIVQQVSDEGIYASRGYTIYFKPNNNNAFHRIGKVPVPFGTSYILGSKLVRKLINKQEVLEVIVNETNGIVAIGGGMIFHSTDKGRTFSIVHKLEHFGYGIGRGVMPQGYTLINSLLFWGEYWQNAEREAVRLLKSIDGGRSWEPAYTFRDGEIRHIHAVQIDPYTNSVWLATGDHDSECSILYSIDGGTTFTEVGSGSQKWRACSLMFTEEAVFWGMDGMSDEFPKPLLWRWDRKTMMTEEMVELDSHAFYSTELSNGTLLLSTDGVDGYACLWRSDNGKNWSKTACFRRKRDNHFGNIRIESYENRIVLSNINLSPFNRDLLILK